MKKSSGRSTMIKIIVMIIMMLLLSGCGKETSLSSVVDHFLSEVASAVSIDQEPEADESPLVLEDDEDIIIVDSDTAIAIG